MRKAVCVAALWMCNLPFSFSLARAARLITDLELALRGGAVEPSLELHEIVREPIDARRRLRLGRQEGERHRLLVDVHPDVDD